MTDAPAAEAKKFSIDDLPWYTVPAILLGVPALLAILSAIWPAVFFDKFVDPYYWSPIRGDTGYNPVNTVSWAILLGLCLLGLTQLTKAMRIAVDDTLIFGAVGWVLAGALFRVVEDIGVFQPPLQYFMITPPIYLMFGAFGVISLLIGIYVQRTAAATNTETALQKLWFIQAALVLVYTLLWAADWSQVTVYLHPIAVALIAALGHFLIRWRITKVGEIRPNEMLLMQSVPVFLMGLAYLLQFVIDPDFRIDGGIVSSFVTVPLLAIGLVGTVISAIRAGGQDHDASPKLTIGFAAFFAIMLGIVIWTAPESTRAAFNAASILSIVSIGVVLGGFAVLLSWLLRHRADIVHIIAMVVMGVGGLILGIVAINFVLERLGLTPAAWTAPAMAVILVGYTFWNQRGAIKAAHTTLKEQQGVSAGFTASFLLPINIFLVVSQVMDGFATSLGLDLAGYHEKHVLSASLINGFETFALSLGWTFGAQYSTFLAFVPVKLVIALAVVYAIDVYSKEDAEKYPNLIGFVKFAIIMVGIGPAVRDFARLSLGV